MVASALGVVASKRDLRLEKLQQKEGRLQYCFAEGVFILRTFAVPDCFFITSSIREKHKGFRMPKVRKTPSLSLLSKNE
jgi:hypothetical protein